MQERGIFRALSLSLSLSHPLVLSCFISLSPSLSLAFSLSLSRSLFFALALSLRNLRAGGGAISSSARSRALSKLCTRFNDNIHDIDRHNAPSPPPPAKAPCLLYGVPSWEGFVRPKCCCFSGLEMIPESSCWSPLHGLARRLDRQPPQVRMQ